MYLLLLYSKRVFKRLFCADRTQKSFLTKKFLGNHHMAMKSVKSDPVGDDQERKLMWKLFKIFFIFCSNTGLLLENFHKTHTAGLFVTIIRLPPHNVAIDKMCKIY